MSAPNFCQCLPPNRDKPGWGFGGRDEMQKIGFTPTRVYPYLGADMDKNEIYWGGGPENATRPQFFSFLNEIYWGWGPAPATRPQLFAFRGGGDGGG